MVSPESTESFLKSLKPLGRLPVNDTLFLMARLYSSSLLDSFCAADPTSLHTYWHSLHWCSVAYHEPLTMTDRFAGIHLYARREYLISNGTSVTQGLCCTYLLCSGCYYESTIMIPLSLQDLRPAGMQYMHEAAFRLTQSHLLDTGISLIQGSLSLSCNKRSLTPCSDGHTQRDSLRSKGERSYFDNTCRTYTKLWVIWFG